MSACKLHGTPDSGSTNLARTGAIVALKATGDAVGGRQYLAEAIAVYLFRVGAQTGYREDLLVLLDTLLELAKEDTETCLVC